jgi:hypothetical protein
MPNAKPSAGRVVKGIQSSGLVVRVGRKVEKVRR